MVFCQALDTQEKMGVLKLKLLFSKMNPTEKWLPRSLELALVDGCLSDPLGPFSSLPYQCLSATDPAPTAPDGR